MKPGIDPERRAIVAGALAAAALPLRAQQPDDDPALRAAIAGAQRSAANRERDGARHPYETLHFFGLKPTDTVLEASPGGGWYTEILAPYLRERGRLVLAAEAADDADEYRRRSRASLDAKLAATPALYDRVVVGVLPRAIPGVPWPAPMASVDVIVTFRNLHDWIDANHLEATLRTFAAMLKFGGVLGVEDHRAPPGSSLAWMKKNGYVTEALMVERARAAGFDLAASGEMNANPRDTHDHPNGVWSLPPTLRGGAVDRERFVAIGESDRFTHRYVKRR